MCGIYDIWTYGTQAIIRLITMREKSASVKLEARARMLGHGLECEGYFPAIAKVTVPMLPSTQSLLAP